MPGVSSVIAPTTRIRWEDGVVAAVATLDSAFVRARLAIADLTALASTEAAAVRLRVRQGGLGGVATIGAAPPGARGGQESSVQLLQSSLVQHYLPRLPSAVVGWWAFRGTHRTSGGRNVHRSRRRKRKTRRSWPQRSRPQKTIPWS